MRILFVCLGNICRSPAAEAVFKKILETQGISKFVQVDSAGTSGFHQGRPADSRMIEHAKKRGVDITSLSRKFTADDFLNFDRIYVMDKSNECDVLMLAKNREDKEKVKLFLDACNSEHSEVPDPYYGGSDGFELVLDLLDANCRVLVEDIRSKLKRG